MATETNIVCDVFTDFPRLKLNDVKEVEVTITIDGVVFKQPRKGVMCLKARARLTGLLDRAWKPPAKRETGTPDA